jgi:hypothetical protein
VRFAKTDGGNVHLRLEGDRVTKVLDRDEASATTLHYRAAGVRAGKLSVWIDDAKAAREVQYVIFVTVRRTARRVVDRFTPSGWA